MFARVTRVGSVDTGHGVWTAERGAPIWVCRAQTESWESAWPRLGHCG
jgi:hypothetical protein